MPPAALGALIQAIGGMSYPPAPQAVADSRRKAEAGDTRRNQTAARRAARPGMAPGARGGRHGTANPCRPRRGLGRPVRLARGATPPRGTTLGALDAEASRFRRRSKLPAAVLRTLPALRSGATLLAVPHLRYPDAETCARLNVLFAPPRPAAGAPFGTG